ncbi:glutathione S-transferase 1-like [Vanessa atalanta]|uniref:glutathione S-transferase 1-like n=1 Tax=Vanessa atalanta TaxID=42275 RepID=UPI001FCD5E22|nr:glutathione S-transferase 1-like [Vanessa atalanta]XP_047532194.1 glutathione S-transferase 1-like [Vanessa atalanta]XP_047532195.1 glutathione S-transferase 1-like [Vanessa atalanta]
MSTTIYKVDASPPARAVLMVADLLGIKYNACDINPLLREQDSPDMTKKNPMRTVPFIEEDGFCLGDSHAIILYLFDKYGKPEHSYLYPTDKRKRATINQRLFFDCGILFPALRSVMAPTYTGRLTELSKSMVRNIEDGYRMLDAYLSDSMYLADDVMTLADLSVITTMSTLHGLLPINSTKYPKLMNWFKNMSEKEICKKINQPGADQHVAGLKAFMENNKTNQKSKL